MYDGHNKTAITSQQLILEALIDLMNEKPYTSISISEICKAASVSRQTFYSLFDYRDNVILYALKYPYCCEHVDEEADIDEFYHQFACYIVEQRHFLSQLVDNNIIYLLNDSLYSQLVSCSKQGTMTSYDHYRSHFIAGGLTGIVISYVKQGCVDEPSTLYALMKYLIK